MVGRGRVDEVEAIRLYIHDLENRRIFQHFPVTNTQVLRWGFQPAEMLRVVFAYGLLVLSTFVSASFFVPINYLLDVCGQLRLESICCCFPCFHICRRAS